MSILASAVNSSLARCAARPWPEEAKLSLPGLALASAISSPMDFAGRAGFTTRILACDPIRPIGGIRFRVEIDLLVERSVGGKDGVVAIEQRVAVGRRVGDGLGCDVAAGARAVIDHERLAEDLLELAAEDAGKHVARSARREGA